MTVKGYDVGVLLKKTFKEINEDNILMYAGMMAYNFFFALFPMLLFFAALLSLIAKPTDVAAWMTGISQALPAAVAGLLMTTLESVVFAKGAPGLLSFGLLTAAWSGSVIFGAFRQALNEAYDLKETRPWWKQQVLQLVALAITGVTILLASVILVKGEVIVGWLARTLGIGAVGTLVWQIVQYPIAIGVVVAVLWMQYYFLPNCRHQKKADVIVGAIVATILWIIATLLFRVYVQSFHAMNPAYGTIGAVMALLTWMYLSSLVLLAAGELNSELQNGTGRSDGKSSKPVPRASGAHRKTQQAVRAA